MAITWGAYSGTQQVGIDVSYSPSTVTSNTSSVTVTWKIYTRFQPGHYTTGDNETLTLSNAISESINFYNKDGDEAVLRASRTQTVSTSYSGSVSRTLKATISGMWNGGTPTHTRTVTIPKRPPGTPSAPVSVSNTRVSDTQQTVSWTRPANWNSDSAKWDTIRIQRGDDGGSYAVVATLTNESATAWTDTSTRANHSYRYRVRSENVSGSSSYVHAPNTLYTTPAVPTNVSAVKESTGDIQVSWSSTALSSSTYDIEDNGSTTVATDVSGSPHLISSPNPAITHQYRVRAGTPDGSLHSAWSNPSNIVQLQAPPSTPSNLAPNGSARRKGLALLEWTHNPVDSSSQRKYQVQWRTGTSGAFTTSPEITSSVSQYYLDLTSITGDPTTIQWRVRTWGAHADPSAYSPIAQFTVTTNPIVTINEPDGSVETTSTLNVEWSYYHAGESSQALAEIKVYDTTDGDVLIRRSLGAYPTKKASFEGLLTDAHTYRVEVRAQSGYGMWSDVASQTFSASFTPPLPPEYITEQGACGFNRITLLAQDDGVAPGTVSMMLERSLDGGSTWELLAEDLPLTSEFIDWTAPVYGEALYRATSLSSVPSSKSVEFVIEGTERDGTVFISGGPGWARVVVIDGEPSVSVTTGRDRSLHYFAGRTNPVEIDGQHVPYEISVSGVLLPQNQCEECEITTAQLDELFSVPGPHLYRDKKGRRMYVTLSEVQYSDEYLGAVSFKATRSDEPTVTQRRMVETTSMDPTVVEPEKGEYQVVGGPISESAPGEFEFGA